METRPTSPGRYPLVVLSRLLFLAAPGLPAAQAPGQPPRTPAPLARYQQVDQGFTFANPDYGVTTTGQTHTQDTLVSWNGWQYLAFWNADEYLALARRELPDGPWETVVFLDAPFSYVTGEDSHNAVSVGICPNDGTIHLAFDHHNTRLNYRRSVPGLATNPATLPWTTSMFGPVEHQLDPARGVLPQVTYPRFLVTPEGNLQFVYREFSAGDGNNRLVDYDAATGTWSNDHIFMERFGSYDDPLGGHSERRYGYFNRIDYDAWGTLHATWTWRETVPDGQGGVKWRYNRDICYAFSEDRGRTWYSATFDLVADQATGLAIRGDSPGVSVVRLGAEWGLMNDQAHVVDQRGRVHVVMYYKDQPDTQVSFGSWADSHYVHWWGDADGVWRGMRLPWMGDRPKMVVDRWGRLLLTHTTAFRDLAVAMATPEQDYLDWRRVFTWTGNFGSTAHTDRPLFRNSGLMSLPFQDQPATPGDDTAIGVVDLVPARLLPPPETVRARRPVTTIPVEQDSYVRNGAYAGQNFGTAPVVAVQDSAVPDEQRLGLLRFHLADLAGKGAIIRATLRLQVAAAGPAWQAPQLAVRRCAQDVWFETGVTWNNRPAPSGAAHPGVDAGGGTAEVDLTDMVAAELATGGNRLTLELSQTSTDPAAWADFHAREAGGELGAVLEVEQSNRLEPVADTYVRGGIYADDNYGADDRLMVKEQSNADYRRVAYLRFDLQPLAGTGSIRKVYLMADSPVMGPLGQTTPFHAHFVADDSWSETGTTWHNRPVPGASLAAHFGRPSLRWDVTAQALAELAGDRTLSLALVSARAGGDRILHLWSREAAFPGVRPRLLVVYQ